MGKKPNEKDTYAQVPDRSQEELYLQNSALTEEEFWFHNCREDQSRKDRANILPSEVYRLDKTWKPDDVLASVSKLLGIQLSGPQKNERQSMSLHLRDDPKLTLAVFDFGPLTKEPVCPHDNSRLPRQYAVPPRIIAHNPANVIVVFNSDGIEQYESVLTGQDVRGVNMSISDIGPKTFVAVRSDHTGKIQILHRSETQHQIMVTVYDQETGESSEKKLKKWTSQCYVVRCIYGLRTADKYKPTYMVEGAVNGLANAWQYRELTGEDIEPVTDANRRLPAEAMFGATLGSNWDSSNAVTELSADSLHQFVDYEDYETFYRSAGHAFVERLARPDLVVATINIEENYTKSHFNESVDLLIAHYSDVLTFRVDVIVARVGKLAYDLGEVGRRTNGKHRADARSRIATMILETMLAKVNQKAPDGSEECHPMLIFGNADPYAAQAALAAANGDYTFPDGLDYNLSKDTLMIYYIDWKKAAITAQIPEKLGQMTEDVGFNHLSFIHTAFHNSSKDCLDIRTIGQTGNRPHHLTNSDLLFKSTDTNWKTPLVVYLRHTEQKANRTRSFEAKRKRQQERRTYLASRAASSSGTALRATVAASVFGSAEAMGTAMTVKDYLLSPWVQFLLVAVLAASIFIMMPPRRGTGRGNSQQRQPDTSSEAAPSKANSSGTYYRPLEDPNDGVTQAHRADRGLVPSDGWGYIQYIEGREVYHDQYCCGDRQKITAPTNYKRRCRLCYEIAKSHGAGRFVPPPPLPESSTSSSAPAKLLASPKLQGPPPKPGPPTPPAENPVTPGEQVRARGRAVLAAVDPETEPEPAVSSVQRAIAQGRRNYEVDNMLAKLHGAHNYTAPAGTRVPSSNLQDNPDYREAFRLLMDLPVQHGVSVSTVQAISEGLVVSYSSVRYYEQALLQVQKDLCEGEELRDRLQAEMRKVDELSSVIANQDSHVQTMEAARINAEQANKVLTDNLQSTIKEKESEIQSLTEQLDKKKEDIKKLQRTMEINDRELSSAISELTIDRQEAVIQYEFACERHSAEITALRAENTRVREQLREAYTERDDYIALANRLLDEGYRPEEVNIADYVSMKNRLASVEAEHIRTIHRLEQAQDVTRRYKDQLNDTRDRCVKLEVEKTELELRVSYLTGAISTAHQLLKDDEISQIEHNALIREEAEWSRREGIRLRNRAAQTQTTESAGTQSWPSNSFVLVGTSGAPPGTSSTIRNEMDDPDTAIQ